MASHYWLGGSKRGAMVARWASFTNFKGIQELRWALRSTYRAHEGWIPGLGRALLGISGDYKAIVILPRIALGWIRDLF
jgi:hypothetical protein